MANIDSKSVGLFLGPFLFVLLLLTLPENMPIQAQAVAACAALMAVWWVTEAVPIPVTALLPIGLFPLLDIVSGSQVTLPYANHLIYLFLGGFLIGSAVERWGLHHRIALHTIRLTGMSPSRVTLGFMLSSAFLSMWISNTAAAIIMYTIATAFMAQLQERSDASGTRLAPEFGTGLMLAVAYSASIGGISTLIGTPANAVLAGVYESTFGESISFVDWMIFGLPLALLMLLVVWGYITRIAHSCKDWTLPVEANWVDREIHALGPLSRGEKMLLVLCSLVVSLWLFRGFSNLPIFDRVQDSTIAMIGAILLFIIPVNFRKREFLLDWESLTHVRWDILLLFGGGFALANGFVESGLMSWLAEELEFLRGTDLLLLVFCISALVIFLTELTSNTATAAMLLPVMVSLAAAIQANPLVLMSVAALASSFAFMMPVATPPNAIVFASRMFTIRQMAVTGFWLNIVGLFLVGLYSYIFAPALFG